MKRRDFLQLTALGTLGLTACPLSMEHGVWNPCVHPPNYGRLGRDLIAAAFDGLDHSKIWDVHAHLVGVGDADTGAWTNPDMASAAHPLQMLQRRFYMNAACVEGEVPLDFAYLRRLNELHGELPHGAKLMLLAFDVWHDPDGTRRQEMTTFYLPNDYARRVAWSWPERYEWICSIHPYRTDCVEELDLCVERGARAVKWLAPAMGIDPASPDCDRFYERCAHHGIPILSHAGAERAVESHLEDVGNPLRLRRALEHGVRVIVAHCASLGDGVDLDVGPDGPSVSNFDLFARLMDEPRWEGQLVGEISALTQNNRAPALRAVIERTDWHGRLLNGSDYPLPGVFPIFSPRNFVSDGLLTSREAAGLGAIRESNPLLFDFVLKRPLRVGDSRFADSVFETRDFFAG